MARGGQPERHTPTPREIREACAYIRAGWTPEERRRRLVEYCERWTPPVFSESELDLAPSRDGVVQ